MMNNDGRQRWQMVETAGITYISVPEWRARGFINAFSCRSGGCSPPPFDSLNLALNGSDSPAYVLENRRRLLAVLGLELPGVVCACQVHGSKVQVVEAPAIGAGALAAEAGLPDCDGLICARTGITLMSFSADCVLLQFIDPVRMVIASAHAGWKGTRQNIAAETVLGMAAHYNCRPSDLEVFIGPAIGPCCFAIGPEVAEQAQKTLPASEKTLVEERSGVIYWNLPLTNHEQLVEIGVLPQKIISPMLCTSCHPELFYSYRREKGFTGRMASLLNLVSKQ